MQSPLVVALLALSFCFMNWHSGGGASPRLVHLKMKILSVFAQHHVVPNLYVFICSAEHKGRYFWRMF